ncbi:MAG: 4Fe-4S dicluster domain-containing protein [Bacillota bacterium]
MKRILINPGLCNGCKNCQLACMAEHCADGSILALDLEDPARQARNFIEAGAGGKPVPLLCRHCDSPECADACVSYALTKNPDTGTVGVAPEKCAGCWMCVMSCPFGMIRPDHSGRAAVKCDFCAGRHFPRCVQACPNGALSLLEINPDGVIKKVCLEEGM